MDVERLKMSRDALIAAADKKRRFSLTDWFQNDADSPCGFVTCAAGDLAMYPPAQDLGFGLSGLTVAFRAPLKRYSEYGEDAVSEFLGAGSMEEREWVNCTILPSYAISTYGCIASKVDRQQVLDRINAKIAWLTP